MRNLYNNCKLVPDFGVMRYNHINDNSTNFIFNYGCCGFNNGRNLYSMNCGGGLGGGFLNGALFAIGNFAANIASGFMFMPIFSLMSNFSPFGNYQFSSSWLNNGNYYSNRTANSGKTEVLAKVETPADKAKKEIDAAIKALSTPPTKDELDALLTKLISKKLVLTGGDYDAYLKQVYQLAIDNKINELTGPGNTPVDVATALAELNKPKPEEVDETLKPFIDLKFTSEEAVQLKELGVRVITGANYNDKTASCLSLPKELTKANLEKLIEIIGDKAINIAVANNTKLIGVNNADPWLAGKIDKESITETNGKITFELDCNGVGKNGNKYKIEQTGDNEYTATDTTNNREGSGIYKLENSVLTREGEPNFPST